MKTSALAASALVAVAALAGAAAQIGSATADSAPMHTSRFVVNEIASRGLTQNTFAGADRVRSKASGEVVGYDSITGRFYPKQEKVVIQVAFALRGGIIVARVSSTRFDQDVIRFRGPILKGSGQYAGIEGTIEAQSPADNTSKTFVTLRYHL